MLDVGLATGSIASELFGGGLSMESLLKRRSPLVVKPLSVAFQPHLHCRGRVPRQALRAWERASGWFTHPASLSTRGVSPHEGVRATHVNPA
jgi:hypothetical protein